MAKSKVAHTKRAPKARAKQPVSETAQAEPVAYGREDVAQYTAKQQAFESQPLTLTLAEACNLVGRDLEPTRFQEQVFDALARDLDVLSHLGENDASGFDGWCAFQNLRARIELAGKIAAVIGGAS